MLDLLVLIVFVLTVSILMSSVMLSSTPSATCFWFCGCGCGCGYYILVFDIIVDFFFFFLVWLEVFDIVYDWLLHTKWTKKREKKWYVKCCLLGGGDLVGEVARGLECDPLVSHVVFIKRKEWLLLFWWVGVKSGKVERFIVKFYRSTLIICSSFYFLFF